MWAKPLWNKSFSKTKYLKFVDSAKEIYKALINIDKIKEKTFNIEYDKLYANETFMEISIKGNFFKGIMGYWFPLVEGIYGVNPINGKLETNQTQYLVLPYIKITPNEVKVRYYFPYAKKSDKLCYKLLPQETIKTNGNSITIRVMDVQYKNEPCPVTIVYTLYIA